MVTDHEQSLGICCDLVGVRCITSQCFECLQLVLGESVLVLEHSHYLLAQLRAGPCRILLIGHIRGALGSVGCLECASVIDQDIVLR